MTSPKHQPTISYAFSSAALKHYALTLGFNLIGIVPAQPSTRLDAYLRWLQAEMHGTMGYLARPDRQARRRDLSVILSDARSLILVGVDYHTRSLPPEIVNDPSRGRIASYAWNSDYHEVLLPKLEQLAAWLQDNSQQQVAHRAYVDTGAILERSHAQQAGLGFIGKNTMLIHPRRGSYFFLGDIVTDLAFDEYDQPQRETMCGNCTRCQSACPTDAFPQPYVLDARRCISYLTIEHKGWIDRTLRPLMGNWIFGCDVCQDVCPFNRFALPTGESAFWQPDMERIAPSLLDLLWLDGADFQTRFGGSPVQRIGRERLVRNAAIAAGNWGDAAAVDPLNALLRSDPTPLVRGHAAWALGRIDGTRDLLAAALLRETDDQVREEIKLALTANPNIC
ncbi:MAG: tRNA epoxyqueuosine(34) reductase QueG [Anaerolineae bacterium]|nr:tRNA epoxyqueuosine(34) reductase QueG [Anaerolineae bacterium]